MAHVAYLPVQVLSGDDLTACTIISSHPFCLYVGAKPMPGWVIEDKPAKWFGDCERKQAKSRKRMHTAKQRSGVDPRGSTFDIPFQTFEVRTDLNTMVISMQCEQRCIMGAELGRGVQSPAKSIFTHEAVVALAALGRSRRLRLQRE